MRKFWLFSVAALALSLSAGLVSAGTEGELCKSQAAAYDVLKEYSGQLGITDEEYGVIAKAGQTILDNENTRQSQFKVDQNYENISKLLQVHAGDIVKAATEKGDSAIENVAFSYRFVFLSCRACHRIYKTEEGLSP